MSTITSNINDIINATLRIISMRLFAARLYRQKFHKPINWKNPKSINEKINWLKFYSDTTQWTELSDKYRVREYIKSCGYGDMLVPLYGKWDSADDIKWDELPEQFVLKANNGSGDILLCNDKSKLDIPTLTQKYNQILKKKFGNKLAEPHYNKIKPCLIAEQLLDASRQSTKSSSLIDYKIWCFNGQTSYILVCANRSSSGTEKGIFDSSWQYHPEFMKKEFQSTNIPNMPRPASLSQMLQAASALSQGFPQVRIDFYEVDGKPYFGEMTFTSAAGFMTSYTDDFLNQLGNLVILNK